MKSAIVLLAAVTVFTTLFLECSSSEPEQNCVSDALRKVVYKNSAMSDNALDDFMNVVEGALAKASDEYKKDLTVVSDFSKELKPQVTGLHTGLKNLVESGSMNGSDELGKNIDVAIKGIEDTLASFETLNLPVEVTEAMKKNMVDTLVPNAKEVLEEMRKA